MSSGINKEILELIESRLEVGAKKYGKEVEMCGDRYWVQEALEEALDLAVYVSARLLEIKSQEGGRTVVYKNRGVPPEDSMET